MSDEEDLNDILDDALDIMLDLDDGTSIHLGGLVDALLDTAAKCRMFLVERQLEDDFKEWAKNYDKRTFN